MPLPTLTNQPCNLSYFLTLFIHDCKVHSGESEYQGNLTITLRGLWISLKNCITRNLDSPTWFPSTELSLSITPS